jgi:hypothetical protein
VFALNINEDGKIQFYCICYSVEFGEFFIINLRFKARTGKSNKYVFIQSVIFASPFPFLLILNAGQFQSGTCVDVVQERFRRIIAKVGLKRTFIPNFDCWKKAIHGGTDWNFPACKFRFI